MGPDHKGLVTIFMGKPLCGEWIAGGKTGHKETCEEAIR